MRIAVRLTAAAVVLAAGAANPAFAQAAKLESLVRDTTLENGLQVIVVKNSSIPFVTVEMVFRAGAFIQSTPDQEGLPHLIEHMLFRRGESEGGAFERDANEIEAAWNGTTDTEAVRYFLTFPSKNLAKGMQLMSDLIRKPNFSKDVLQSERPVVIGELLQRASEPQLLLRVQSDMLLWENEGWRSKNPGGNIPTLNAATPDLLNALYKRFYVPNNAALVVAGDVTETQVFDLASKIFRGWKRGDDPMAGLPPPRIPPLTTVKRNIFSNDVKEVTFLVRWQGPSVGKDRPATYAADVFAGLVGQPLSGTQRRLVDAGHFDAVSLNYETLNYVGPIALLARTSSERAATAAEALGQEIAKLSAPDYFSAEDLALAKKWQRVSAHFRFESASTAAHILADFWSTAGLDYYLSYEDKLDAQTPEDIRHFLTTYIAGKPLVVTVLIPQETPASVVRELSSSLGEWKPQ